jgi:hypothetical protein
MADAIVILIASVFSLATPIGIVIGIVMWSANTRKRREAAWARVAHNLGLSFAQGSVFGRLQGRQVSLRTETRGSGKSQTTYTVVSSALSLPLDLGLNITQQGYFDDTFRALGLKRDIQIGDPAFDAAFAVSADEPHRVQALLSPDLKAAMHAINEPIVLSDAGFSLSRRGVIEDEQWIAWALRVAANVTGKVKEARRNVPVASPLAGHRNEWKRFAASVGLHRMSTPLCMWGSLNGTQISAYAVRVGQLSYRMEVLVHFDMPLHVGLYVRPAATLDEIASLFGGEDRRLNDPAFDKIFLVKASRPERLPMIFDETARKMLVDLHQRFGAIQVRDDGMTLRSESLVADPSGIPRLATYLRDAAKRISDNALGSETHQGGPYR